MTSSDEKASTIVEQGTEEVSKEENRRRFRNNKSSRHAPRYTAKWTDADIIERGVSGKVTTYVCRDGSGSITRNEGGDDALFVHYSNIVKPNAEHLVATLAEEEAVKFDVVKSGDRFEAVNVTGAKGKAVVGNEEAPVRGVEIAPKWAIHFIPAIDQPTRHYGMKKVYKESGVETDGEDAEEKEKTEWLAKWTDDDIIERGVVGTMKWFQVIRGFGFVARDNAGETADLFVHRTSVLKPNPKHIIESLADEERIKFDIVKTEKGQEAVNITGVDGGAVVGSEHAPIVGVGYIPFWAFDMLAFYRSRNGKGGHRGVRRHHGGPRLHRRRNDDDSAEKTPSEKGASKPRRRNRGPRKPRTEETTGEVDKLAEVVAKVEVGDA